MKLAIRILAALPALLFLFMALQWLFDPGAAAAGLGMSLLPPSEASTQIGDIGALFLAVAGMGAFAQLPGKAGWFYPPAWLLLGTAAMRSGAWLTGHASFAVQPIVMEIAIAAVFVAAARTLGKDQ